MDRTCKDCEAFVLDEDNTEPETMPGVCILNPPQMVSERDPESGEALIVSAFPKVDGQYTRCMKLVRLATAVGLVLAFSSCAPRENLGGQSILGHAFSNYWRQQDDKVHGRGYVTCRTSKNPYGTIVTECR